MEEIRTVMTVEIATGQYFYTRPYVNVKEKNLLWPIPEKELALNPALEQNPDWK
ncbi:SusD family protein [compost metagenome]